jgi:hypothetical protein
MTQRINYQQQSPALVKTLLAFSAAIRQSAIEESIRDLVDIRASQLNGCAPSCRHLARVNVVQPA